MLATMDYFINLTYSLECNEDVMEYNKSKEIFTVMDIKIEHICSQKGKVQVQVQSRKRTHARYRRVQRQTARSKFLDRIFV